jgi:hypothetical protein
MKNGKSSVMEVLTYVNIEKTQKYYHSIKPESLCDCNYCKNYYEQIKADYPAVASYLSKELDNFAFVGNLLNRNFRRQYETFI